MTNLAKREKFFSFYQSIDENYRNHLYIPSKIGETIEIGNENFSAKIDVLNLIFGDTFLLINISNLASIFYQHPLQIKISMNTNRIDAILQDKDEYYGFKVSEIITFIKKI